MRETLRFKSSCIRAGDVISADEQVMLDINRNSKRIRAVCEQLLDLLGARGHIVAGSGAQLGDGLMRIDVEIRLARESLEIDEKAYWCAVRRKLPIAASEAQQDDLAKPARPEAAGDGRHAAPADRPADPKDTVSTTSSPSPHGGEADQEGGSGHGFPDLQPRYPEVARAPQSQADLNDEGEPSMPGCPEGTAEGVENSGNHQAVSVHPDGRTPADHAASGGQENGEPAELYGRPQTLLLGQEPVDAPGVQREDAPAVFPGADEPLGERRLEQHVDGNWAREPLGPNPLVDPPPLMLRPPVAQVDVVCIERRIVRLARLRGWRSPEVLITTDPNEDQIAVGDNLSERLFGLPVMSRGLFGLGKFWVEHADED